VVNHLKGGRLLAFDPIGVEGVDQGDGLCLGNLSDDVKGLIEVSFDLDDPGAVGHGLGQLAEGNLSLGNENVGLHPRLGGISGCGGRGVSGRCTDDRFGSHFFCHGNSYGHPSILERACWIETLILEIQVDPRSHFLLDSGRRDERGVSFEQCDDAFLFRNR
jgi:hypothetical protein